MKVGFSEPECINCFPNTQETEPSYVTGSSASFRLGPFGSTSATPSAPAAIASVSSGPANTDSCAFGPTQVPSFGVASTPSAFGLRKAPPPFGFVAPTSSRPVSSTEQTQSFGSNGFGIREPAARTPTLSGTMQAPVQASSAYPIPTFSISPQIHGSSLFGPAPAVTSVSSASTQSLGGSSNLGPGVFPRSSPSFSFATAPASSSTEQTQSRVLGTGSFAAPTPSLFATLVQASSAFGTHTPSLFASPVQASSAAATSSFFGFRPPQDCGHTASVSPFGNGIAFARPDVAILPPSPNQTTDTIVFGTTPVSVPSLFAPPGAPKSPFSSSFPRFGESYSPGFGPNPSGFTPFSGGACSGPAAQSTFTGIANAGEGTRHTQYVPTRDLEAPKDGSQLMVSISASDAYRLKSHEELRWEDYQHGDKGGSGSRPSTFLTPSTVSPSMVAPDSFKRWEDYERRIDSRRSALFTASTVSPSIVVPDSYRSHEELRWEDYERGIDSRRSALFTASTVSPSMFASANIFDQPPRTTQGNRNCSMFSHLPTGRPFSSSSGVNLFQTLSSTTTTTIPAAPINSSVQRPHETTEVSSGFNLFSIPAAPVSSNVQRPHETTEVSSGFNLFSVPAAPVTSSVQRPHETTEVTSTASGCTACGATSSPSASVYSAFNGLATPTPAAATSSSLPGPFFSFPGSFPMMPMMFGGATTPTAQGMAPAFQAYPMMFGTPNLPAQGSTPAIQAYPVQCFLLLPFAAMNLQ